MCSILTGYGPRVRARVSFNLIRFGTPSLIDETVSITLYTSGGVKVEYTNELFTCDFDRQDLLQN